MNLHRHHPVRRQFVAIALAFTLLGVVGIPGVSRLNSEARAEQAGGLGASVLDLGTQSTCSVRANGAIRCFGPNTDGQNGPSSLSTDMFSDLHVPIGGINPRTVSAGARATCFGNIAGQQMRSSLGCVGSTGAVGGEYRAFSVGKNGVCRERLPAPFPFTVPPTYAIICSGVDDGSGWAGGSNGTTSGVAFTNTANPATNGFTHIALSGSNSCATVADPAGVYGVRCWGLSSSPVIGGSSLSAPIAGLPSAIDALAITPDNGCVLSVGVVYCWGATTTGVRVETVGSPAPISGIVKAIALGGQGACALRTTGTVTCWGGEFLSPSEDIVFGPDSTGSMAIVTAVAMAENHSCVQLSTYEVRCWGDTSILAGSSKDVSVPFVELPETRIDSGPVNGSVTSQTATFAFTATPAPGATFLCHLDNNPDVGCISPVTYTLPVGSHSFAVSASNAIGPDPTPAIRTWTVDVAGDSYAGVAPQRLLDTRGGPLLAPAQISNLTVTGVAGVPANATSVALNVVAVSPAASGHLRVYPTGSSLPTASVLNFAAGKNVPNHVIVKVGTSGQVSIYAGGSTHVIVDVVGYFFNDDSLAQFVPVLNPTKIFEGGLDGTTSMDVEVVGLGGLPGNAGSPNPIELVAVNIAALTPQATGHLRVWTTGEPMPNSSTHNFVAGDSRMNLVLVRPNVSGRISIYNASGAPLTVTVYPVGVFRRGGLGFMPTAPQRTLDTRTLITGPVPANGFIVAQVRGFGAVPNSPAVKAVAVNIAAVAPQALGTVNVGPSGTTPTLPTFTHPANENVANLALVRVGQDGYIRLVNNSSAPTHVIVDINGYFTG